MTLTSIWFVARIVGKLGLTLQDCETETLFPTLERVIGEYVKEFVMAAHESLYVIQVADNLDGGRSIVSNEFGANNPIDNVLTQPTSVTSVDSALKELIIDFGSDATRDITFLLTSGRQGSGTSTLIWNYQTSDDDITYSSDVLIDSRVIGGGGSVSFEVEKNIASFRYLKVILETAVLGTGGISEVYAKAESGGHGSIQFELKDDERVQWIETAPVAVATTITKPTTADVQTEQITQISLPNCTTGKLRAKLTVIDGKSKDSVFVIKYGKQA